MKLKMYSFFDSAASAFTNPFFMHNDGLAIRAFQDNINSEDKNNMSLHPEQFTLFQIADWDDKAATLDPLKAPKEVARGFELKTETTFTQTDLQEIKELIQALDKFKQ